MSKSLNGSAYLSQNSLCKCMFNMEEENIHKVIGPLMIVDSRGSNMDQPSSPSFMTLPPECRDMIYHPLLVQEVPIRIASPRSRTLRDLMFSSARASILYVNRQIHAEAIRLFYSANTFVVGNGPVDSTQHENEQGLISFVNHVPSHLVTSITKITLVIHLRPSEFISILFPALRAAIRSPRREAIPTHYGLGTPGDAADVWHISQLIVKHFKSVKSVGIDWVYAEKSPERAHILSRAATVAGLANAIRLLMKLPQAREIHFWDEKNLDLRKILDRVLKEELETGREVTTKFIPYEEGKSGRRIPQGNGRDRQGESFLYW
jgi:hypothetical protein